MRPKVLCLIAEDRTCSSYARAPQPLPGPHRLELRLHHCCAGTLVGRTSCTEYTNVPCRASIAQMVSKYSARKLNYAR